MAYNTPETVADYLARFQMEITQPIVERAPSLPTM